MTNTPHLAGSPWTVQDAADFLHISSRHLRRLIDDNRIRSIRMGRRIFIPDEVLKHVAEHGIPTQQEQKTANES